MRSQMSSYMPGQICFRQLVTECPAYFSCRPYLALFAPLLGENPALFFSPCMGRTKEGGGGGGVTVVPVLVPITRQEKKKEEGRDCSKRKMMGLGKYNGRSRIGEGKGAGEGAAKR